MLVKMQSNRDSHSLLVEMQIVTATLEERELSSFKFWNNQDILSQGININKL